MMSFSCTVSGENTGQIVAARCSLVFRVVPRQRGAGVSAARPPAVPSATRWRSVVEGVEFGGHVAELDACTFGEHTGGESLLADDADRVLGHLWWSHLERAHILSQPYPWPHTRNHAAMLVLALRQHDRREALGQVVRIIVAARGPLSLLPGRQYRTRAGLMTPVPIHADLAEALAV